MREKSGMAVFFVNNVSKSMPEPGFGGSSDNVFF